MTYAEQIALINSLSAETGGRIDDVMAQVGKRLSKLQKEFLQLFVKEIVLKFQTDKAGAVTMTPSNLQVIAQIDEFFERLRLLFLNSEIRTLAADMLGMSALAREYFEGMGFTTAKLDRIQEAMTAVDLAVGIKNGKLLPGGYLDRLAKTDALKQQLYNAVTLAINSEVSLSSFTNIMRRQIVGNKDADGFLESYYRQYVYDKFNQVHEISQKAFADGLGLKHFIYAGSLIDTSRRFCEKRAGKAYSTDEAKKWKDDPDLIDKKTKDSYNPIIERGRYNCRHFIRWISEDLYYHMRPDKKNV